MSWILEILKCILCCEDEKFADDNEGSQVIPFGISSDDDNEGSLVIPFGISHIYNTFSNWTSSPKVQLDRATFRNQQKSVNSLLINSTRKESLPQSTPRDLSIHSRVVLYSQASNPSSTGLTKGKGVARIYQEPLNPSSSSTKPNFPPPPSKASGQSFSKLTPPPSLKPPTLASKPSSSSSITPTSIAPTSFPSPGRASSIKQHLSSSNPSSTTYKPSAASINPQSVFSKPPSSSGPSSSASNLFPSFKPTLAPSSAAVPRLPSPNPSPTSSRLSAASVNPQSSSPKLPSSSGLSSSSASLFPSLKPTLAPSSAAVPNPQSSFPKPPSSSGPSSSSQSLLLSFKPTLAPSSAAVPNYPDKDKKGKYIQVENDQLHFYMIPENIENLIKKDIVPELLKKPLSPSTYKDYFAALLYAEDFYIKKWSNFELQNVSLKLHEAAKGKDRITSYNKGNEKDDKIYVAFEVGSTAQRRPFLLSKDTVFARPLGRKVAPFQGVLYRVVKNTTVLVEFGEDFHSQHRETQKYDISFSFNRVSLERGHQAIAAAASDPLFQDFLFPKSASRIPTSISLLPYSHKLDLDQNSVVHQMLNFQGPPPFLVEGQFCATYSKQLSRTGLVIVEAILQIYRHCPESQVLVCAPIDSTCDVLMRGLKKDIPESDIFQANVAFGEIEKLPIDNLKQFRVVLSTFVNSYCLREKGISAGHFNHIFLVDASSATEPETMVALANLADEKTAVIATGAHNSQSSWVRLDIARHNGLSMSYFQRLCQSDPYRTNDPRFISHLFARDSRIT